MPHYEMHFNLHIHLHLQSKYDSSLETTDIHDWRKRFLLRHLLPNECYTMDEREPRKVSHKNAALYSRQYAKVVAVTNVIACVCMLLAVIKSMKLFVHV